MRDAGKADVGGSAATTLCPRFGENQRRSRLAFLGLDRNRLLRVFEEPARSRTRRKRPVGAARKMQGRISALGYVQREGLLAGEGRLNLRVDCAGMGNGRAA